MRLYQDPELVSLMADTYAESVRAGADMRAVVESLERIRTALSGDVPPFRALWTIDDQIGRAGAPPFQPVLVALRERVMGAFQDALVAALRSTFATNPGQGWTQWLDLYAVALGEWRVYLCEALVRLPLDFPPHDPSIGQIREWTRLAMHERWPEIYDWACWLAGSSISAAARGRMHLLAGKIQLYRFARMERARVHFEQAESLQPADPELKGAWGQYWRERGDRTRARELFLAEIGAGPDLEDGYTNMGSMLGDDGDLTGAERYMQQAIANCPGSPFGYVSFLEFLGEPTLFPYRQNQLADLRRRIAVLAPWYPEVDRLREAEALDRNERTAEARSIYLALAEKEPDRLRTLIALGDSYRREWALIPKGRPEEAEPFAQAREWYEKAITCAPAAMDGYGQVADLLKDDGQIEPALELWRRALGLHPEWEPRVRSRMGELLFSLDRLDEARSEFERALALEPRLVGVQAPVQRLGDTLLEKGRDADAAVALYELVRDKDIPASEASYQNRVGNALYYVDRDAEAAEAYRLAIAADGTEPVYFANLAGALEHVKTEGARADELGEAISALDRAIELAPSNAEYAARRERLEELRDFFALYGETAPEPNPVTPIRLQLHDEVMPRLLNEGQSALTAQALLLTDGIRARIAERTGINIPGIRYGWLSEPDRPEGTWRLIIREGIATVEGELVPWGDRLFQELPEQVGQALEANIWAFVTHETVAELLEKSPGEQFAAARNDLRLLNRLVAACREHARSAKTLRDLGNLVSAVVQQANGPTPVAQGADRAGPSTPSAAPAPRPNFRVPAEDEWWFRLQLAELQTSLFDETGVVIPVPAIQVDSSLAAESPPLVEIDGARVATAGENLTPHAILRPEIARFVSTGLVTHYLASVAAASPVLVETARQLLGVEAIRRGLVERLHAGKSIRDLAGILEEMLSDEATVRAPAA